MRGRAAPSSWAGTAVLVTGASSGIGAATAGAAAARGARLLVSGRDDGRLAAVAGATGAGSLAADLTDRAAPDRLAGAFDAVPGARRVAVLAAGRGLARPFADTPAAELAAVVELDLTATLQLSRTLLPGLRAAPAGAALVLVSSVAGVLGVGGEAVYSAAKAGLSGFADALREELAGTAVRACVVVPGVVDTPFFDRRGRPYDRRFPRPVPARVAAAAVLDAADTGRPTTYVPRWLALPARLHGGAPGLYRRLVRTFG